MEAAGTTSSLNVQRDLGIEFERFAPDIPQQKWLRTGPDVAQTSGLGTSQIINCASYQILASKRKILCAPSLRRFAASIGSRSPIY